VTDSLPAIALGLDPANDDIMTEKPTKNTTGIFNKGMWTDIFLEGSLIGALAILSFSIGIVFFNISIGRTMAFTVLSISQLIHAFNMRSEHSILNISFFNNKFLVFALLLGIILQITIVSTPVIASVFKVTPLSTIQWLICSLLAILPIPIVELQKSIYKNK
jgi:Ca2+-transporting ATPase